LSSAVAGIIDASGGLRVVVTEHWRMGMHVGEGERLFIVPDLEVQEPLSMAQAAPIIEIVKKHIADKGAQHG